MSETSEEPSGKTGEFSAMGTIETGEKIVNYAQRFGNAMRPPPNTADDKAVQKWRWFIVVAITVNSMVTLAVVLVSWGLIPIFPGFATKSDLLVLEHIEHDNQVEGLDRRMLYLRQRQCDAMQEHKSPQAYTIQLSQALTTYRGLTNREPQLPNCGELE